LRGLPHGGVPQIVSPLKPSHQLRGVEDILRRTSSEHKGLS